MPAGPPDVPGGVPEHLHRRSLLAVVEVAKLRQNSALVWGITWGLFLGLLLLGAVAIGAESDPASALGGALLLVFLAILLPAGASIVFGWASSERWGKEYKDLVLEPQRLPLAWLPGIRAAKSSWNRSRTFLWISWGLGPEIVLGALFYDTLGADSQTCVYNSATRLETCTASETALVIGGLLALCVAAFLACRGFHHYYFARSVALSAQELAPGASVGRWEEDHIWWILGTFTIPLDPVFVYLITLFSQVGSLSSDAYYGLTLGAVVIAGVLSLGASCLLVYGYRRLRLACGEWLYRQPGPLGPGQGSVPPEWLSG